MDPKQTEGQNNGSAAPSGGFSFSSGPNQTGTLSTGANVSRTIDSLNDRKSDSYHTPFAKHQFHKVAPKTGDILISPSGEILSEEPKFRLNRGRLIQAGLIIGGIALVALTIVTVVLVINNNSKNSQNNTTIALDYQSSFNRFANWMIYGDSSTEDIALTSEDTSGYYVRDILNSSEDKLDYFNTANNYYEDFYNAFNNSDFTGYISLTSTVISGHENLKFYTTYLGGINYSDQELLSLYLNSPDTFTQDLDVIYSDLANNNSAAVGYAERGKARATTLSQWFSLLSQSNCIKNDQIDETCANKLTASNQSAKQLLADSDLQKQMMDIEASVAINKVIYYISSINSELQNPVEVEEYTEEVEDVETEQDLEGEE